MSKPHSIRVMIGPDRRVLLELPAEVPEGLAEIVVHPRGGPAAGRLADLQTFLDRPRASTPLSRVEAEARIREIRAAWEE